MRSRRYVPLRDELPNATSQSVVALSRGDDGRRRVQLALHPEVTQLSDVEG
jgi:hypothetical protein